MRKKVENAAFYLLPVVAKLPNPFMFTHYSYYAYIIRNA